MALGDLSTFSMLSRVTWVAKIVGELQPATTAEEIVAHTLFTMPDTAQGIARSGLRGLLRRLVGSRRPASAGGRRAALAAVMTVVHDVQVFGTEAGIEVIGVPFPHIIFMVGTPNAEFRALAEQRIAELLASDWNDLIDPLIELRVRMFLGQDTGQNEIVGFFGRGIFAPRRHERPIGRIEIAAVGSSSVDEPVLPGGIPAGLYRGQSGLVFSNSEKHTPAVSLLLPENCRFLLRGSASFDEGESPMSLGCEMVGPDPGAFRPLITAEEPPPPGYDAVFKVEPGDGTALEIKVIEDERLSRLFAVPPPGRFYFAIMGIVAPQQRDDLVVRRWWIDLDRDRKLVSSALRPRAFSVVSEDDQLDGYDWSASGQRTRAPERLLTITTPEGEVSVIHAGAQSFGSLRPPPRAVTVSFDSTAGSARHGEEVVYSFDWLDFAGAVETPSHYAERLAVSFAKQSHNPVRLPGLDGQAMENPGFRVRRPNAHAFEAVWTGVWEHETELIVGPLLLRVVDREGRP